MASYITSDKPARRWAPVVTTSDVTFADAPRGLFIGGAGNVVLVGSDGATATFSVPAGTMLPVMPAGIRSSGTTATNIIALS